MPFSSGRVAASNLKLGTRWVGLEMTRPFDRSAVDNPLALPRAEAATERSRHGQRASERWSLKFQKRAASSICSDPPIRNVPTFRRHGPPASDGMPPK
jgi:hypothetical protein